MHVVFMGSTKISLSRIHKTENVSNKNNLLEEVRKGKTRRQRDTKRCHIGYTV